jgi:hypothetical protein
MRRDGTSEGRFGIVVVVVVVIVVVSPGKVEEVVVEVVVVSPGRVEEVVVVVVGGGVGHDAVAAVGMRTAGVVIWAMVEVVASALSVVTRDGSVGADSTGVVIWAMVEVVASASDTAGAAAGASLYSHASNWSTTGPIPTLRAHDATFCCRGSLGWARTYRTTEVPVIIAKTTTNTAAMRKNRRRFITS